jgi:hypothetical protein
MIGHIADSIMDIRSERQDQRCGAAGRSLCGKPPLNPLSCRVAAKLNPLPRNLCNRCSGCYRCYKRDICDMCYIGSMGSILSIRNVPEGLLRRLKVESAKRGETLRALCIRRLDGGTEDADVVRAGGGAAVAEVGSGDGGGVSVLRGSEGTEDGLHKVQPVRHKLAGRGAGASGLSKPESGGGAKCAHGYWSVEVCRRYRGGC